MIYTKKMMLKIKGSNGNVFGCPITKRNVTLYCILTKQIIFVTKIIREKSPAILMEQPSGK